MFRRRITLVLALFALVMALAALLAAASLAVTERQVLRGRVASDIATGFIQLSAQKQRLRTWVAQMQQGAHADSGARAELLAAMQGTLQRLKVLTQQAIELDGSAEAREEHLRRRETLVVLERSVAALAQAVDRVRPLEPGADAPQAWEALSRVFDMPQGHDVRRLIAENIEDSDDNMTRFVVLAREGRMPDPAAGPVMTTLIFEVKNVPAALYKAMGGFATNGVNMTKLESYQRGASFSATEFYADIEGMPGDPGVDRALEELAFHSKWVRLLGSYRQARPRSV